MANHELQFFSPLAISQMSFSLSSFDLQLFTLPYYLSEDHKERLVTLLLSALRSHSVESPSELLRSMLRVRWDQRSWLNAAQVPSIQLGVGDVLWLVVDSPVTESELLAFIESCHCLALIDLRIPHTIERTRWMVELKHLLLDSIQHWWGESIKQDEARKVDFRNADQWFDSPIDALDYCNAIASGLFGGHSLVYVKRQAMAGILANKALEASLPIESIIGLIAFALRERWDQLRFKEPTPIPNFDRHFSDWQKAGLGWHVGAEFVPLNAVEKLAEREVLDPFFAYWDKQSEANTQLFDFWNKLREALMLPEEHLAEFQSSLRLPRQTDWSSSFLERNIGETFGDPKAIQSEILKFFPGISPEAIDSELQEALTKEPDQQRRLLLLAWRVSLWLERASDRKVTNTERLRSENDALRTIEDVWNQLDLKATPDQLAFVVAKSWAQLRVVLADHLNDRARGSEKEELNLLAREHCSKSLAIFQALKLLLYEAEALQEISWLLRDADDLAGAQASQEKAIKIFSEIGALKPLALALLSMGYKQISGNDWSNAQANFDESLVIFQRLENRQGEAYVLNAIGRLQQVQKNPADARASYEKALAIFREIGDRHGEANTFCKIGNWQDSEGNFARALESYEKALPIYQELEDREEEANTQKTIGLFQQVTNDLVGARASYEKALALFRELDDQKGQADVLTEIGWMQSSQGDLASARNSYNNAIRIYQELGDRQGEAEVLWQVGRLQADEGDSIAARASYEKALKIFRELKDRQGEANTLMTLGLEQRRNEDLEGARASWEKASLLFREIENWESEAQMLRFLAGLDRAEGSPAVAFGKYQEAANILRKFPKRKIGEAKACLEMGLLALEENNIKETDHCLQNAEDILNHLEMPANDKKEVLARYLRRYGNTLINAYIKSANSSFLFLNPDTSLKKTGQGYLLRSADLYDEIGDAAHAKEARNLQKHPILNSIWLALEYLIFDALPNLKKRMTTRLKKP